MAAAGPVTVLPVVGIPEVAAGDDLGELVTKMGGTVLVVPAERMELPTGLAATYRY